MPRPGRPWYRTARAMWFATINGVQTPLGITDPSAEAAALAAFQSLTSHPVAAPLPAGGDPVSPPLVREITKTFLAAAERRHARGKIGLGAIIDYRRVIARFEAAFGGRPVADLATEVGADEVEDWCAAAGWSPSTGHTYLGIVLGAFKLAGVKTQIRRPSKESRGEAAVLTDDQFAAVLASLRTRRRGRGAGDLADLLEALRLTGCRPQEVAPLEAADLNWGAGTIPLKKHKTRNKTGEDRVIHLTAAALALFERQRERHPTGPLFPTQAGKAYTRGTIVKRLIATSERLGFRAFASATRHSFASAALANGVPDTTVAELLGHVDTKMIHAHYKHLSQRGRELRAAAELAAGRAAG